ncbi:MAG: hypothetical protein ACE5FU_04830 [Nitrospinota bacterium]
MKIVQIGPYPPPNSGWSVRIKFLKEGFIEKGDDCQVLNLSGNRKVKSPDYIDVQGGFDYLKKLFSLGLKGYHFHIHTNGQSEKGPLLHLTALFISLITLKRPALTFHGGLTQIHFPRKNASFLMYFVIYLLFLLSKVVICNNEEIKDEIGNYGFCLKKEKIFPVPAFSTQYLQYKSVDLPDSVSEYIGKKRYLIVCYVVLRNGFYIENLVEFLETLSGDIGVILSGIRQVEDKEVAVVYEKILEMEKAGKVLTIPDLNHDEFMTLLEKTHIYLRTPVSDGVASSVLEALSQRVAVVASENGRRPPGVFTYQVHSSEEMQERVSAVLGQIESIKKSMPKPVIRDTLADEIKILEKAFSNGDGKFRG